jgi:DNA mismatch endonuclease, patch repair protein
MKQIPFNPIQLAKSHPIAYAPHMADTLTPSERSLLMSKIRSKNTAPERAVRSLLHRAGYRFRIHVRALPGTPDIVLTRYRLVVFVHGCFWHRHPGCKVATTPKTHKKFWTAKFARNVANDQKHRRKLRRMGWRVVTVWACQLKSPEKVLARIEKAMQPLAKKPSFAYVLHEETFLDQFADPPPV